MNFGQMPDGSPITRHTITGGGLTAHVLSFGAVLQDLRLDGHAPPLVLGFETCPPYLTDSPNFGGVVGRCANRIGQGQFAIDGQSYQVDLNFDGRHHLHGGSKGAGVSNWAVEQLLEDRITLRLEMADGHMGYPGNMTVRCTYACLAGGVFDVQITAQTDAPSPCNFAHHSYWNLDGAPDTKSHLLQVDADRITGVDADYISTGETPDVTGTRYDFRTARVVPDKTPMDNNLCLSDQRVALREVASLHAPASGLTMRLRTTEAGLQVYEAATMDVTPKGLDGRRYGPRAGLALEAQTWPDAINHDHFPSALLRPDDTYTQHTQFVISKG